MAFEDWILDKNLDYDSLDENHRVHWLEGKGLIRDFYTDEWLGWVNSKTENNVFSKYSSPKEP